MFGASDPNQALLQLESYHREGRLELAEVMASDMTDRLMSRNDRDDAAQAILVKGLRILAGILHTREKYKRARITIGTLHKHRNRLGKAVGHDFAQAAEDYRLAGCIHAAAGKNGAAKRAFKRCQKLQSGHLAAALDAAENCGNIKALAKMLSKAGPVIRANGIFVFQIQNRPDADARRIAMVLGGETQSDIERQIAAIEAGEQAANVRLQAAMDKLTPKHDYHSYSKN